ncbi:AraC family transcriptional regulator [Aquitalea aquatica]|uniref:Helix-turn-helix domain-containing protein n=1 Tax=Aquitalea aquatica TaxID=3044273 RepID=A0A838Y731_9NEIS|nr:nuclear transport factor 2 family protein [Aquitalea magnusonii]MBA4709678.1 helix-turn-helix domain-containing protein [Aquitalea magnusonii]
MSLTAEQAEAALTRAVVERYHQAWKQRSLEDILALYHPDISYHDFLQNRVFRLAELRDYVQASLPQGEAERLEHCDRIRVDGDTAFIQYQMVLRGSGGLASFQSSEAISVRDGLIWRVREYATLQHGGKAGSSAAGQRSPLQRLGLSARQLGRMAEDLHSYFRQQQPYLQADCTLAAVASATGYSRNQLSYLLNQVLGQSFYRYVNQARLQHLLASLPVADSMARIDQLAFAAGFNSLSVFYRCFRDHTGLTPAAWLRRFPCGSAQTTSDQHKD